MHSQFAGGDHIRCAMPETTIGLFPDVGATYWLSLPGRMGQYLALTGSTMNVVDVCQLGLMKYKVHSQWGHLYSSYCRVHGNKQCKRG